MTPLPLIQDLRDAQDVSLCGGKATKLGQLLRAGFDVPPGFVLTTHASATCKSPNPHLPETLRTEILTAYRTLLADDPHTLVAVRSSATAEDSDAASLAGQYESFLNVADDPAVIDAIERCLASANSARTRAYLSRHGVEADHVPMAVVVQRQARAEVAGVLFTANPHTGSSDEIVIEATWGLGETLVSGLAHPDIFRLRMHDGSLIDQTLAEKTLMISSGAGEGPVPADRRHISCLDEASLRTLWQLARKVSTTFELPQDVEWALERDPQNQLRLRVLQSRAITTMAAAQEYHTLVRDVTDSLRKILSPSPKPAAGPLVLHNLAETLPHPTPLTWSVIGPFMTGTGGFGEMYRLAGFDPSPRMHHDGFLHLLAGKIYMDAACAGEMFFAGFPYRYDPHELAANPDATQNPPTLPAGSLPARMRAMRRVKRANAHLARYASSLDGKLNDRIIPAFAAWCRQEESRDLSILSTAELIALWETRRRKTLDEFSPLSLLPSLIAGQAVAELQQFLAEEFWNERLNPSETAQLLASPNDPDRTLSANAGLWELGQLTDPARLQSLSAWLVNYGHRGPNEFDLSSPRWRERPADVLSIAEKLRNAPDPFKRHDEHIAEVRRLEQRLSQLLPARKRKHFAQLISLARRYMIFRENGKYHLMRGYCLLRDLALECGKRMTLGNDVFLLSAPEMLRALDSSESRVPRSTLSLLIAHRKIRRAAERRLELPALITDPNFHAQTPSAPDGASQEHFEAFCLSAGIGSGPVRVVLSPEEATGPQGRDLGEKYVLVCPSTDPNWTPLFMNAAALVLERGGSLSHGAVVAREMGIPAVVFKNATTTLRDGEHVVVDAHQGRVRRGHEITQPPTIEHPPELPVPPTGNWERKITKSSVLVAALWIALLLLIAWMPQSSVYQNAMEAWDELLWPLILFVGKPWTVAILAGSMAAGMMLTQRFATDTKRLRAAKARGTQKPKGLQPEVQARLLLAGMFPIALLLGPMVTLFLWLPLRMNPAADPPPAPADATLVAKLQEGGLHAVLQVPPGVNVEGDTHRQSPPIRKTLLTLLDQIRTDHAPPEKIRDLEAYLAQPIEPQTLTWKLHADHEGQYRLIVMVGREAGGQVRWSVGQYQLPGWTADDEIHGPLHSLELIPAPTESRSTAFWTPFKPFGFHWDLGWLGIYIITYIPLMFLTKRLLRVP